MKKLFIAILVSVMSVMSASASAHVVVGPGEVKTATRTTFAVSVPNEHQTPVVEVRLLIPDGLESIRPFAKSGWNVRVVKSGEGEDAKVTEIIWSGGSVPVDLKDEFQFGAKTPANETELQWKAYETYQDGTVIAWDQPPSDTEDSKPYSVTKIISGDDSEDSDEAVTMTPDTTSRTISIIALVVSLLSFAVVTSAKKKA
jgi:uncharacterized protein YcnI